MSRSQLLNSILDKAKEKGKKYGWLKAANLYEQALRARELAMVARIYNPTVIF